MWTITRALLLRNTPGSKSASSVNNRNKFRHFSDCVIKTVVTQSKIHIEVSTLTNMNALVCRAKNSLKK